MSRPWPGAQHLDVEPKWFTSISFGVQDEVCAGLRERLQIQGFNHAALGAQRGAGEGVGNHHEYGDGSITSHNQWLIGNTIVNQP